MIDVVQGTCALPQANNTPLWCQQRVGAGWHHSGVFVLSEPSRTPEGAVMT